MRWLNELLNPALRCKRVGHRHRRLSTSLFMTPDRAIELKVITFAFRAVAVKVEKVINMCPRCRTTHSTTYKLIYELTGLTMSSENWQEMREKGEVEA
jgi:hypothetical protein